MRLSISMPEDLHKQVLIAAANQQLKTLKSVTASDFIRDAIQEKLNMLTCDNAEKDNSITSATTPVLKSTVADTGNVKKRSRCKITPELHAEFVNMQKNGATAHEIADAIGCSIATISGLRKKLKEGKLTAM